MPAPAHGDGDVARLPAQGADRAIVWVGASGALPSAVTGVDAEVADVVDAVQGASGDVLLVTRDASARRTARAVRLALGSERIALFHADVPVTAWVLGLHLLAPLVPTWPPSQLGAALTTILQATRTRVALSSLAALEKPSPTFGQYAAGLMPWTAFDVDLLDGTIVKAAGAMAASGGPFAVARSAKPVRKDYVGWMPGALEVAPAGAGWKARRWCEATDLLASDAEISAALAALPTQQCPVCDRPGSSAACLFCEYPLLSARTEKSGVVL